jgi:hypothetical protein
MDDCRRRVRHLGVRSFVLAARKKTRAKLNFSNIFFTTKRAKDTKVSKRNMTSYFVHFVSFVVNLFFLGLTRPAR